MAKKTIELAMEVQDATKQGLSSVQNNIEQAKKKLAETPKSGMVEASSKLNENLGKTAQLAAQIQVGVAALEIGFKAASLAAGMLSGDLERQAKAIESIDSSMKTLPFGFGKIYSLGQQIRETVTGERAEIEKINSETERRNKQLEATSKILSDHKKLVAELNAEASKNLGAASGRYTSIRDRIDQVVLSQNPDDFGLQRGIENRKIDREIAAQMKAIADFEADQLRINDEMGATGSLKKTEELESAKRANEEAINLAKGAISSLEELRLQSIHKINEEEKKYRQKQLEEATKLEAEKTKIAQDEAKKRADFEAKVQQTITDATRSRVDAEIEMLTIAGNKKEAERRKIQADFEREIQAAKEAANKILDDPNATSADRDKAQAALRSREATARDRRDVRVWQQQQQQNNDTNPALAMRSSRFLTGASDQKPQDKQLKTLEEILLQIKRANDLEEKKNQVAVNAQKLEVSLK